MRHTYIKPLSTPVAVRMESPLMDASVAVSRSDKGIKTNDDLGGTSDFNRSKDGSKWGEW